MRYSFKEIKSGVGLLQSMHAGKTQKTYIGIARNRQFVTWGEWDQQNNKAPKTARLVAVAYPTNNNTAHHIVWDAEAMKGL